MKWIICFCESPNIGFWQLFTKKNPKFSHVFAVQYFPELKILENPIEPALIFTAILALGLGITLISTFFATQRYLNLKSDAIY